jgi:archaellum component FlaF (FlaF/FlaG flagellin family)
MASRQPQQNDLWQKSESQTDIRAQLLSQLLVFHPVIYVATLEIYANISPADSFHFMAVSIKRAQST